jgi:hypothetical protein
VRRSCFLQSDDWRAGSVRLTSTALEAASNGAGLVCEQTRKLHAARDELRLRRLWPRRRSAALTANISAGRRVDLAVPSEF